MTKLLKNFSVLLWIFFIVISLIAIHPRLNANGLKITSIDSSSPLVNRLKPGDIIYKINNEDATQALLEKNYTEVNLDTNKGKMFFLINGSLGVETKKVEKTNLKFGLDIRGGTRAIIKPDLNETETKEEKENMVRQIITTLQTRINVYGLQESTFKPVWDGETAYIQIELAGGNKKELQNLLEKQGKFEAKIPLPIENNKIHFNDKYYDVPDEHEFELEKIKFEKVNESYVEATVYSGSDVKMVYMDPEHSWLKCYKDGCEWGFQVLISQEGVERFDKIIKNIPSTLKTGEKVYLTEPIKLYLDDKLMDELRIAASLKTSPTSTPAITGGAENEAEAVEEKRQLQSILRSGALPAKISIEQMDVISPKLGSSFLRSAAIAGLGAIIAVMSVVFIRYRRLKLAIPVMLVSLSEVLIILGASVFLDVIGFGWTIDLAALGGIIAAVGTGVDSQIIILDESISGEKREWSLKERLKRAFFMIFGAGGTTIGAMLPLMVLGFGLLRGFAITASVGVLVGILITRRAFGVIVRHILED